MTFIEAFKRAAKQSGMSDEEIKGRLQQTALAMPLSPDVLNIPVAQGMETEFVNALAGALKKATLEVKHDPEKAEKAMAAIRGHYAKKN